VEQCGSHKIWLGGSTNGFVCPQGRRSPTAPNAFVYKGEIYLSGNNTGFWKAETPIAAQGREVARRVRQESAARFHTDILPLIRDKQSKGAVTLQQIADALNAEETPTSRGRKWTPTQVMRVLKKAA
jgi:Recombinase